MDEQTPSGGESQRRAIGPATVSKMIAATAAVSLVVGLIAGPILSGHEALAVDPNTQPPEHTITVSGVGRVSIKPDVADIVLGVSVTKPTAKDARSEAALQMMAVLDAVKKLGIEDRDIATTGVNLQAVYDYGSSKPRLTGYQFNNSVKITVRNLEKLPSVLDDAVSAGSTVVSGISFRVDDPKNVQAQAREMAMQDAKAKAEALARAGNVTIKGVATIAETSYTPPAPLYYADAKAEFAAAPSTPIQVGTTDVQVQVTVAYLI